MIAFLRARHYLEKHKVKVLVELGIWNSQDFAELLRAIDALGQNLLELARAPEEITKCHELRIGLLKEFETIMDKRVQNGTDPRQYLNLAKAARIDAEIELLRFMPRMEPPQPPVFPKSVPEIPKAAAQPELVGTGANQPESNIQFVLIQLECRRERITIPGHQVGRLRPVRSVLGSITLHWFLPRPCLQQPVAAPG